MRPGDSTSPGPEPAAAKPRPRFRSWILLLPPLGIIFLWVSAARLWRKLAGTLALGILSLVYAAAIVLLLIRFTGLEIEWRGGYLPALTYHKTRPNFEALERSRKKIGAAANANKSPMPNVAASSEPY